jgi:FtsP/CotA-like multicopper oxidase with cupredoxin domain
MKRREFLVGTAALATLPILPTHASASPAYVLRTGTAEASLRGPDEPKTLVWAYDHFAPGPVIRIPRAKPVYIRVDNALPDPTTVHWHGIRIENAMDGVSGLTQQPIMPGASFDYHFTAPDAGTYWYHSHHRSWEQIARGLYGLLIVNEDTPVDVDADLAFIADDWRLDEAGQIAEGFGALHEAAHGGRLGNWLTVNGDTKPKLDVRPNARVRLRCVSAANARVMAFEFPGLTARVIALDGQPLENPKILDSPLILAPAQRADLVIDMPGTPATFIINEVSVGDPIVAAELVVSGDALADRKNAAPLILPSNPLAQHQPDIENALHIDLLMQGGAMGGMTQATYKGQMFDMRTLVREHGQAWAFNGNAGKPVDPLVDLKAGQTAVIDMINDTRWPHAMHLHGHHFRVLEIDGKAVTNAPWRDTQLMQPAERIKIAFVADNPGKWLFHCHMLEHHMAGMGTWINVA